ncbi:MBL fold metallo-hydrolase [Aquimarina sp. D1M17]|uniref:MBL fold metallo-hydrolase n=1 Tax=Aquimarina acroporae TaxID=2937283 RepID=UPI0020BE16A9|nr:MBL fold metallo-hydrolase [Aquimarina acroporae]MCK8522916.1 MBL fold metallo-hydrolase [Aquimarina acroporae]
MGVYITDGESSVLIDGLHEEYGPDYLFPTPEIVTKISSTYRPNAILFTHKHGDHFSEKLSKNYLKSNTKALIFGANQITQNFQEFKERVYTITTKNYQKQPHSFESIKITGVKIDHAGKRHRTIENVGYLIDFDNTKILHVGDTDWLEEINLFPRLHLTKESIDIAIVPYWMLLRKDATELLKKHINPKYCIATHISPRISQNDLQELKRKHPNIYFLTALEQQIQL